MPQADEAGWIDVSVTVRHGMAHWPGNPPIVLERVMDLGRGDDCNVSHLAIAYNPRPDDIKTVLDFSA